ncbi:acyl-CoA N-acyltransferase [Dichotomocladium elegans]|nr:acyl-CoA N-acyltransferase [Dichotomocladium elegans]
MMTKTLQNFTIREADESDLQLITDLYNEAIVNSTSLFVFETVTVEEKKAWLDECRRDGYAVIVAVDKTTGQSVAFANLSSFRSKPAYNLSAEVSVYIHPNYHRRGLGRMLVNEMLAISKRMGLRVIYSVITGENTPSIQLFKSLGFRHAGLFKNCGYKFGRWLDVEFWEMDIPETQGPGPDAVPAFIPFPWGKYIFTNQGQV